MDSTDLLFSHGTNNSDQEILAVIKTCLYFFAQIAVGNFNIILGSTILCHEVQEPVVNVDLEVYDDQDERTMFFMYSQAGIRNA